VDLDSEGFMELLNVSFAVLLLKLCIGVLPIGFGIFIFITSEDTKRDLRSLVCRALFNVSNAIPMKNFNRMLFWMGFLSLLFGLLSTWVLILQPLFK
jgi:hypothetical protein